MTTTTVRRAGFTFTQVHPAATWTIRNPLGHYPAAITIKINNEEVETDTELPDIETVVLTFPSPQSGSVHFL